MTFLRFRVLPGFLTLACAFPAAADMISSEGMEPYEVCALCHGLDGLSAMDKFPRLAGQKPDYILKQIGDFREGRRTNDGGQMRDIVTELHETDAPVVAEWFSSQPAPEPDPADPATVGAGEALFEARGCGTCHLGEAPDGLTAPHVAAQHEAYLIKQLKDFREGARENDPQGIMREKAAGLSDEDIAALAVYLSSLPRN
jgi:cytochrome c553